MARIDEKLLSTKKLGINVPGRTLVEALDIDFRGGEFVAVLGRNGSGKTLSIMTMAGLREAQGGEVTLGDVDIFSMTRAAIATKLALLPQSVDDIFPATVLDTVLIGRHPHIPRFQWETNVDRDIAFAALRQMDIADLAGRDVLTLSGGERRRLAAAQILAQSPAVYLLDEPTNHLDPQHQLDLLTVFRETVDAGACVVASLHDVNLAARFADRCLLLFGDGRWELGPVNEILSEDSLEALYGTPIETVQWRSKRLFVVAGNA